MDGTKPKKMVEKPIDKKNTLNLNEELNIPNIGGGQAIDIPQPKPNYTAQSYYTRKQIPKALAKKRRKIARKSRQINRKKSKNK